jgi:hypothetical protein
VEVDASNVALINIRAHHCAAGIDIDSGGGAHDGNVTVRGCLIHDISASRRGAAYGIALQNDGRARNTIDANVFADINGIPIYVYSCCADRLLNVRTMCDGWAVCDRTS